jgi:hypothetical protein
MPHSLVSLGMQGPADFNDEELEIAINGTFDKPSDSILYQLSINNATPTYEHTLPLHRTIYDKAHMEMYALYLHIKNLNPDSELVGIITDCLVLNNITQEPPTSNEWGGINNSMFHVLTNAQLIKTTTKDLHV